MARFNEAAGTDPADAPTMPLTPSAAPKRFNEAAGTDPADAINFDPYQPVAKVGIQGSTQRGPTYYTRTYGDGYDP